jgi:hypothetical protein
MAIWSFLWPFGLFYGHLVYFMAIWSILWPFGLHILRQFGIFYVHLMYIFYGRLVYFMSIRYILCRFGIFYVHLVYFYQKNLATLNAAAAPSATSVVMPAWFCTEIINNAKQRFNYSRRMLMMMMMVGKSLARKRLFLLPDRVTRLGEFSPIGRMLFLWAVLFNCRNSPNFRVIIFSGKSYALILTNTGSACILGDYFKNSSGHPAPRKKVARKPLKTILFCTENEWRQAECEKPSRMAVILPSKTSRSGQDVFRVTRLAYFSAIGRLVTLA